MNETTPSKREHAAPTAPATSQLVGAGIVGNVWKGALAGIVISIAVWGTAYTAKHFSRDDAHQSAVQREQLNEANTQTVRKEGASERTIDSRRGERRTPRDGTKTQARTFEATARKASENAEKAFDYITDAMVVVVGIAGGVGLFSWFHSRRAKTRAKRQAREVEDQSSREPRPKKLNGLHESIHRLEELINRSFRENELGGHRYRACAREAMVQGESIAGRIRMLELAKDTDREKAHANEELEALQEQVERVSRAIATSGLGAPTSETSLAETMRTLETMEARASRYTETRSQHGDQ